FMGEEVNDDSNRSNDRYVFTYFFRNTLCLEKKIGYKTRKFSEIMYQNNSIVINACNQYTTEIVSTIGREGQIYIPAEVRRHFDIKGIKRFEVFIDEINKRIILKPNLN